VAKRKSDRREDYEEKVRRRGEKSKSELG